MRFEEIIVICTIVTGIVAGISFIYRKIKPTTKKGSWFVETCRSFFPVFALVLVLRSFLFEPFRIPSGSMKPTLLEGDFILVNKFVYGLRLPISGTTIVPVSKPKMGDIIVFRHGDKDLIKRVIGVPGDKILYQNKQLYVNDKPIQNTVVDVTQDRGMYTVTSTEYLNNIVHNIYEYPQISRRYAFADVIVPPNSYFVMGDNRSNSEDSRVWGFVLDKQIVGKAIATWLSWNSEDDNQMVPIRWSRIGKSTYQYIDDKK